MEIINDLIQIFLITFGLLSLYIIIDQTILIIKWIIKYAAKN